MRLISFAVLTLAPLTVSAQPVTRIDGAPQCAACSLQLRKVATLGSKSDPILMSQGVRIARDSKGNFYAAPVAEAGRIAIFDSTGRYLRALGKAGTGPGELARISHHTIGKDDTLHVLSDNRYSKITPRGDSVISVPIVLGYNGNARFTATGELAIPGTPTTAGASVNIFTAAGTKQAVLGGVPDAGGERVHEGFVVGDSASIWIGNAYRYQLEKWSFDARRLSSITRSVPCV